MADRWNVTDVTLAVLSIVFVIVQVSAWLITRNLPSRKVLVLEKTLGDTEALMRTCMEEGRFPDSKTASKFEEHLRGLRSQYNDLRIVTAGAKTFREDIRNMLKGYSGLSDDLCREVIDVRAKISVSTSERSVSSRCASREYMPSQSHGEAEGPSSQDTIESRPCTCQHAEGQSSLTPTDGATPSHTTRPATAPAAAATPLVHDPILIRWIAYMAILSQHLAVSEADAMSLEPVVTQGRDVAGRASEDAQTSPLQQDDLYKRQSVPSNKSSPGSSVWRKKQNKAIARARERTRLLRRAYL